MIPLFKELCHYDVAASNTVHLTTWGHRLHISTKCKLQTPAQCIFYTQNYTAQGYHIQYKIKIRSSKINGFPIGLFLAMHTFRANTVLANNPCIVQMDFHITLNINDLMLNQCLNGYSHH